MKTRLTVLAAALALPLLLSGCSSSQHDAGPYNSVAAAAQQQMVDLPNVSELSLREAEQTLSESNLQWALQGSVPSGSTDGWHVVSQYPAAGTSVTTGTKVLLYAEAPLPTIRVPDVKGMSGDHAKGALEALGLKVVWKSDVADPTAVQVTGVIPKVNTKVQLGDTIIVSTKAQAKQSSTSTSGTSTTPTTGTEGSAATGTASTTGATTGSTKVTNTYYANCDAVRAAGVAPITRDDPGYSSKLDKDGDGVGCE